MSKSHATLTGASLHEPKGVTTATSGQVYRADGAGSGSWQSLVIPTGLFTVGITTFVASGTWTKPPNLFKVRVHVQAAGGAGSTSTIAATGGSASFGAQCSATGGVGGNGNVGTGGAGGVGSSGNLNFTGVSGIGSITTTASIPFIGGLPAGPWGAFGKGQDQISGTTQAASGGGGGYAMKEISAIALGATETVTVNTGGASNGIVVVEEYVAVTS